MEKLTEEIILDLYNVLKYEEQPVEEVSQYEREEYTYYKDSLLMKVVAEGRDIEDTIEYIKEVGKDDYNRMKRIILMYSRVSREMMEEVVSRRGAIKRVEVGKTKKEYETDRNKVSTVEEEYRTQMSLHESALRDILRRYDYYYGGIDYVL